MPVSVEQRICSVCFWRSDGAQQYVDCRSRSNPFQTTELWTWKCHHHNLSLSMAYDELESIGRAEVIVECLWSLLLVHQPGPCWKLLIALFAVLHFVYRTNSPQIFASLVRYSLLYFHLSRMAVHHFHHPHYHRFHLLSLVQSHSELKSLGSLTNTFLYKTFFSPTRLIWFHRLSDHFTYFYSA